MNYFFTNKAISIGDRISDIEAAKKAGLPSIAVSYGFGNGEIQEADRIINKFKELLSIFE